MNNVPCFLKIRRGVPWGYGTIIYFTNDPQGRYNYTGDWVRGKRQGSGTTIFRGEVPPKVYIGEYDRDRENGRGKIKFSNGDIFTGFFVDGKRVGEKSYSFCSNYFGKTLSIVDYSNDLLRIT